MDNKVKRLSCEVMTEEQNMTTFKGERMCEGCAEATADQEYYEDPHGKNWQD